MSKFVAVVATAFVSVTVVSALEKTTLTGQLVSLACYKVDYRGRNCTQACTLEGFPVALLSADGKVYQVMGDFAAHNNAKLVPYVSHTVELTGNVGEQNGQPIITATDLADLSREVKLDNEKVRVLGITEPPHQPGSMREHLNSVVIYLDGGKTALTKAAGDVDTTEFKAGDVRWVPAGTYQTENTSGHSVRIVEIELKTKAPYSQSYTKLDPTVVVPEHYHIEFENEQVRVLRIHFDPHTSGGLHEHILERVVCELSGEGRKPGEVHISGPQVHQDTNNTDQAAERIAVELK